MSSSSFLLPSSSKVSMAPSLPSTSTYSLPSTPPSHSKSAPSKLMSQRSRNLSTPPVPTSRPPLPPPIRASIRSDLPNQSASALISPSSSNTVDSKTRRHSRSLTTANHHHFYATGNASDAGDGHSRDSVRHRKRNRTYPSPPNTSPPNIMSFNISSFVIPPPPPSHTSHRRSLSFGSLSEEYSATNSSSSMSDSSPHSIYNFGTSEKPDSRAMPLPMVRIRTCSFGASDCTTHSEPVVYERVGIGDVAKDDMDVLGVETSNMRGNPTESPEDDTEMRVADEALEELGTLEEEALKVLDPTNASVLDFGLEAVLAASAEARDGMGEKRTTLRLLPIVPSPPLPPVEQREPSSDPRLRTLPSPPPPLLPQSLAAVSDPISDAERESTPKPQSESNAQSTAELEQQAQSVNVQQLNPSQHNQRHSFMFSHLPPRSSSAAETLHPFRRSFILTTSAAVPGMGNTAMGGKFHRLSSSLTLPPPTFPEPTSPLPPPPSFCSPPKTAGITTPVTSAVSAVQPTMLPSSSSSLTSHTSAPRPTSIASTSSLSIRPLPVPKVASSSTQEIPTASPSPSLVSLPPVRSGIRPLPIPTIPTSAASDTRIYEPAAAPTAAQTTFTVSSWNRSTSSVRTTKTSGTGGSSLPNSPPLAPLLESDLAESPSREGGPRLEESVDITDASMSRTSSPALLPSSRSPSSRSRTQLSCLPLPPRPSSAASISSSSPSQSLSSSRDVAPSSRMSFIRPLPIPQHVRSLPVPTSKSSFSHRTSTPPLPASASSSPGPASVPLPSSPALHPPSQLQADSLPPTPPPKDSKLHLQTLPTPHLPRPESMLSSGLTSSFPFNLPPSSYTPLGDSLGPPSAVPSTPNPYSPRIFSDSPPPLTPLSSSLPSDPPPYRSSLSPLNRASSIPKKISPRSSPPISVASLIPNAVRTLLQHMTILLQSLESWSRGQTTGEAISDVYVRLATEFNLCVGMFREFGVDFGELLEIPNTLRYMLEEMLNDDPSPERWKEYEAGVKKVFVDLLKGLKEKETTWKGILASHKLVMKGANLPQQKPATTV